jgi:3-phenylpropionate/trans-cinnamate dioxygenase ferredoxin subunit
MTNDFIKLASKSDIAEGTAKVYQAGDKSIAVCNVAGTCFAVANLCTHDGGPLGEGELIDNEIECPRHGARFNVETGKVTCMPAVVPIATYALEERNGELWIDTCANAAT